MESAGLVARRLEAKDWALVFQSRSGRPEDPWLGPDVCDYLRAERAAGLDAVVLCPLGFLCDHIEVLHDLDHDAAHVCRDVGLAMTRAEAVNDDSRVSGHDGRRGDADVESLSIRDTAAAGAVVAARACRRPAAFSMTLPGAPVRLGVSSCLLGERVRFDGGHKRDQFLVDLLGRFVEWVPVCPELESGMGAPREALRLTLRHTALRLVTAKTGQDQTAVMRQYASETPRRAGRRTVVRLRAEEGFADLRPRARARLQRERACRRGPDADCSPPRWRSAFRCSRSKRKDG